MPTETRTILVTGSTGYIGGRLVPRLLARGYHVRCMVRNKERLRDRAWANEVEVVEADALNYESLASALESVDVAYYLISVLNGADKQFIDRNRRAATNFGKAAKIAGVRRVIYLGRIRPEAQKFSAHLMSRLQTGDYLRRSMVSVTEFRAGVIIGSGSLSFELIRYVTERLPVLVVPRWVNTKTQPIAVRNVLSYLVAALTVKGSRNKIIEIGGDEILTYGDMIRLYAEVRGLRRSIISVPVSTPRLSALFVGTVTPIAGTVARRLIEDLGNEVLVTDDSARRLFNIRLFSYKSAVRRALQRFAEDRVDTTWTDAVSTSVLKGPTTQALTRKEGIIVERFRTHADASPESVFAVLNSIGGDTGWLYGNALWKIRGLIDMFAGGVGLRKTRRSYSRLRVGDTVDFWRVEAIEQDRLLRLRAEMKVPGKAWLQYEISPLRDKVAFITQTAFYEPKGIFGSLYWYFFYIPHRFIFPGLLKQLKRRAEILEKNTPSTVSESTESTDVVSATFEEVKR